MIDIILSLIISTAYASHADQVTAHGTFATQQLAFNACNAYRTSVGGSITHCVDDTTGTLRVVWRQIIGESGGHTTFHNHRFSYAPCPSGTELNPDTNQCEEPPPVCQTGVEIIGNAPLSGNACLDGCSYTASGGIIRDDLMHGRWTSTGQTCTEGNVTETTDICVTVNGEQLCLDTQQTNCGTFNGSDICVDVIPPGNCALLPGGSYICEETAQAPPAPNSGTPGVVADPDAQVVTDGGTVDYYSENTVSGSTGLADGTGVQYGSGTADPGNVGDGGDGGDDGDGAVPTGPGDFGSLDERMGEVRTITESGDALMDALTGPGSVYAQVQDIQVDPVVGQCPTVTVPFFDNITMDLHCTIFDEVKPVLAVVFQLIWVIVGILIVLSA